MLRNLAVGYGWQDGGATGLCSSVLIAAMTLLLSKTSGAWAAQTQPAVEAQPARRPNIVVILTDDQVFRALGCAGNKVLQTPHLDRLAAQGMRFTTAVVATPVCVASRASLFSGRFPQQHGSTFLNNRPFVENVRSGKLKILPDYLAKAGYVTGFCGKSHLGDPIENLHFQEGHEFNVGSDEPTFEFAEAFIAAKAASEKPFFLWIAPRQPHIPLKPPDKWRDYYAAKDIPLDPNFRTQPMNSSLTNQGAPGQISYRDGGGPKSREDAQRFTSLYYAVVSHLDEQIGAFLRQLTDLGLERNTLILFLSDNGYHLGNHGVGNKLLMYEESIRVPFIVRYPAAVQPGRTSDELVSSLDVMPTVLDFAGAAIPDGLEGLSLRPLLAEKGSWPRKEAFSEACGVAGLGIGHRMVRTQRWKYMLSDANEEGLFDLEKDPYELRNLIDETDARTELQRLRQSLTAWMDRIGDGHPRPMDTARSGQ